MGRHWLQGNREAVAVGKRTPSPSAPESEDLPARCSDSTAIHSSSRVQGLEIVIRPAVSRCLACRYPSLLARAEFVAQPRAQDTHTCQTHHARTRITQHQPVVPLPRTLILLSARMRIVMRMPSECAAHDGRRTFQDISCPTDIEEVHRHAYHARAEAG